MRPVLPRIVTGLGAGFVATLAMSLVVAGGKRLGLLGEPPPRRIVRRFLERGGWRRPRPAALSVSALAAHLGFGASMGGIYGVLPARTHSPLGGWAFGMLVWAANYAGWLPKAGLMPRPLLDRPGRPSTMVAAHLVFGRVLAAVLGRRRRQSLAGKNVLLTGGSRGLGLEIARVLVAKGAHVALVARDAEALERAAALLRQRARPGVRIFVEACDVTEPGAIGPLLDRLRAGLGLVDVLVNNAGVIQVGPLDSMRVQDFEQATRIHYFAPLELMLGVRADMRARGGGRIANVASIGGAVSVPHLLPYSGSKFALVGLSRGMRTELAADGIVVTTVLPGLMRTGSPRNASFKGEHRKEYAWFKLADSLPIASISSQRAARRIVRALEYGESEVVLGWAAQAAALASGVAPGLVASALGLVHRLLPSGDDPTELRGYECESNLVPRGLTLLTDRAAIRNNER
ncbi:MAG TPA: SDR family NAD(P)-dependent oxidoreductase [Polyangiaceae bacterium]